VIRWLRLRSRIAGVARFVWGNAGGAQLVEFAVTLPLLVVFVVGIFDFMRTIEAARADPKWAGPNTTVTGYAFAALFYFACCYGMSRYARRMETRLARSVRR